MKPIIPNFTCLVKKMFPKYRPTIAMQAHVLLLALIVVKMVGWCTLCGFEYYKPNIAISDFFLPLEMIALQISKFVLDTSMAFILRLFADETFYF